jgi:flagellar export protein FliJ
MKKLGSLIRVHRWRVDEARRKLAGLEKLADELRGRAGALDAEVEGEKRGAGRDYELGRFYGAYAQFAVERRNRLARSLAELQVEIAAARDALAAAFEELKRYETTAERQLRAEAAEEARAEQARFDDVGLSRHRRGAA